MGIQIPNFDQVEAVKGGSNALEPGVYLVKVIETDPNHVSGQKKTPGLRVTLEAIEGTIQSDDSLCVGKRITDDYWYPRQGDKQESLEFKAGRLKYLAVAAGIPTRADGFDDADLVGCELVAVVNLGDPSPKDGRRYSQVNYVRPAKDYAKESAGQPEKSPGFPPPVAGATQPAAAQTGDRYAGPSY